MAKRKPVDVGNLHFDKQGDALAYFKRILWSYQMDDRVNEHDTADLSHLLSRHKEFESKAGSGVDHFVIMLADEGSRCFGVVRSDGTKAGFSYKRCVTQIWK